ncbi:MAG TPA: Hsp20/alpha crystallin family protein [Candidatus Methylomirabilis sp.]|nr:Hsp20/alpha crystallin family protein [Candidatus Methylomirabilis sp.]
MPGSMHRGGVMTVERANKHCRDGELVQVSTVAADEQTRKIHAAIARRAFDIFESRGSAPWHELEDWRSAEKEMMANLCFGQTTVGQNLWLGTDASRFCEGTIGIWVAPRQLTIFGKPRTKKGHIQAEGGVNSAASTIFRVIPLPCDVDPAAVTARIRGSALEIVAKKAPISIQKDLIAA